MTLTRMATFLIMNSSATDVDSQDGRRLGRQGALLDLTLALSFGLWAGLLEVLAHLTRKTYFDPNQLLGMPRSFVWTIPLANGWIGALAGLAIILFISRDSACRRTWLTRIWIVLLVSPPLMRLFPHIYSLACIVVGGGAAVRLGPALERWLATGRRFTVASIVLPGLIVLALGVAPEAARYNRLRRDQARPLPPPGSSSVLFIVLDTVAAEHLKLYGYPRATSTTLEELAEHGVTFTAAQAAASWTLPSHASFFTGRWPHELSAGWFHPLDSSQATLAEFLANHGYDTAGFVANTLYCAYDSGLDRGFSTYLDYAPSLPGMLKTAVLIERPADNLESLAQALDQLLARDWLAPLARRIWWFTSGDRKDSATINRQLLHWLDHRSQQARPFFAFLNYYDAHYPYQLPPTGVHRFSTPAHTPRELEIIQNWWQIDKRNLTQADVNFARDRYDDCIAHLDESIGRLIDQLNARKTLDHTWVFILGDHGESFGEHPGVFCHGISLYQTEVRVPLLIIPPNGGPALRIHQPVSLRDLPATIVDLLHLQADAPFPGLSLQPLWTSSPVRQPAKSAVLSEIVPNNPLITTRTQLASQTPTLASITHSDWTYIHDDLSGQDELFHLPTDPLEQKNRAGDLQSQDILARMRDVLRFLRKDSTDSPGLLPVGRN